VTAPRLGPADAAAALAVAFLWGGNMVAVKAATMTLPPFFLLAMRFLVVGLVLAPFFHLPRRAWRGILGLALVLGVGHFGLLFVAVSGMDAASAAVAVQMSTPFSALIAWVVYRETLGWGRALGIAVAFVGIVLLAGEPRSAAPGPLAVMMVSAFFWAASNVLVKRLGPADPVAVNGWVALVSAPLLFVCSALVEDGQIAAIFATPLSGWLGMAYTIVGASLIAYTLWYRLIARHALNRVVPITLLGPAVGVSGGVLLLGEPLTWEVVAGGLLILAGVALVQILVPRGAGR